MKPATDFKNTVTKLTSLGPDPGGDDFQPESTQLPPPKSPGPPNPQNPHNPLDFNDLENDSISAKSGRVTDYGF